MAEETCLNCGGLITSESNKCCKAFYGSVAGIPISAHVPFELKKKCDKLLRKQNRTSNDNEKLHDGYWVDIYYKGHHHGYHGVSDDWTYSARELSDLNNLNDFVYQLLGKKKTEINGDITTTKITEENRIFHIFGAYNTFNIELSFKPKSYVLNFVLIPIVFN